MKKWKAVMEFAKRTELRSSPTANQNARSVYNKLTQPKTYSDRERELRRRFLSRKERKEHKVFKTSRSLRTLREVYFIYGRRPPKS